MNGLVREVVGVFDSQDELDRAVEELEATEFPRHDITVIGDSEKMKEYFGDDVAKPEDLMDNPAVPRGVSVRPEEKTIAAAFIIGGSAYIVGCGAALWAVPASYAVIIAAITAGSLIGAALGGLAVFMMSYIMERRVERQIGRGGLLLWVRADQGAEERRAQTIMHKYGAHDVHAHYIT